jgi:hypothetical protein
LPKSIGGDGGNFCEALRDNFGIVPFSGVDALSGVDFASSSDMLDAGESILVPFRVTESLVSSLFNLIPLTFGRSSNFNPVTVPEARPLPSMAADVCARGGESRVDSQRRSRGETCQIATGGKERKGIEMAT